MSKDYNCKLQVGTRVMVPSNRVGGTCCSRDGVILLVTYTFFGKRSVRVEHPCADIGTRRINCLPKDLRIVGSNTNE